MKIGFIGLGHIGGVMANNLLKGGHDMIIHDLNHTAGEEMISKGAEWADTPKAIAEAADTIITSLPGPPQVRAVMEGEYGVLEGFSAGKTWIDMSTTDNDEVKRLGALAKTKGVPMLEAPVTGGLTLAKAGGISILVGGEKEVFDAQLPILSVVGGKIVYIGPLGSASIAKVITNNLALGHLLLAGESFLLAKQAGIDLNAMFEGVNASSGASYTIEKEIPLVFNGSYDVGFSMALTCKDLGLTMDLARKHGVPMELSAIVEQMVIRAKAQYGEDANSTQAVKILEDSVNSYLRAPGWDEFR
ncbi:MAG: NAD(P)-dependent oxidoreductase [Deltaproteobacteria bacterium]|jgi:3-hydroxyisobutyrate dehydrogenase|nr:NAD(P)-dependent oxidoreductase [Deltaproteobacteria bacterium]